MSEWKWQQLAEAAPSVRYYNRECWSSEVDEWPLPIGWRATLRLAGIPPVSGRPKRYGQLWRGRMNRREGGAKHALALALLYPMAALKAAKRQRDEEQDSLEARVTREAQKRWNVNRERALVREGWQQGAGVLWPEGEDDAIADAIRSDADRRGAADYAKTAVLHRPRGNR